ncbi:MAG: hypothetical protein ACOYOB_09155 [Myxococcota bacterium]
MSIRIVLTLGLLALAGGLMVGCGAAPVQSPAVPVAAADEPPVQPQPPVAEPQEASGHGSPVDRFASSDEAEAPELPGDSHEPLEPVAVAVPEPGSLPSDAELADSWARVLLRANPGPFQYVAYELTVRGSAGIASHVRGAMGRRDVTARTELLSRETLRKLLGHLRDLGAMDLPAPPLPPAVEKDKAAYAKLVKDREEAKAKGKRLEPEVLEDWVGPSSSPVPLYELSFRLNGKENTILVADPYRLDDRRYAAFIDAVRQLAVATAGDIGYQAPSGPTGQEGYLFIDSVPGAKVSVDGVALDAETPILSYPVSPGSHLVVLENERLGLRREYKVRVQPGMTTSLEVDLR